MMIVIRGRTIRVNGNEGMRAQYVRLYSTFTDDRLDELEQESNAEMEAQGQRYAAAKGDVDDQDQWDWISIRDRFDTLSDALDTPPDSHDELASELESMAKWIRLQGQ